MILDICIVVAVLLLVLLLASFLKPDSSESSKNNEEDHVSENGKVYWSKGYRLDLEKRTFLVARWSNELEDHALAKVPGKVRRLAHEKGIDVTYEIHKAPGSRHSLSDYEMTIYEGMSVSETVGTFYEWMKEEKRIWNPEGLSQGEKYGLYCEFLDTTQSATDDAIAYLKRMARNEVI